MVYSDDLHLLTQFPQDQIADKIVNDITRDTILFLYPFHENNEQARGPWTETIKKWRRWQTALSVCEADLWF